MRWIKAVTLLLVALPAWGQDTASSPLEGMRLTGWEMMTGGADRTEVLAFATGGGLQHDVDGVGQATGSWHMDETGAPCLSLPDLGTLCGELRIDGTRAALTLRDANGALLRMWSGDLAPL